MAVKEAKKKAEHLKETIKEKQSVRRAAEKQLVQNSLQLFRETVNQKREEEARAATERSHSAPRKHEDPKPASQELFDDIFETVKQFYERYESQSVEIRKRVDQGLETKLKKLDKFGRRANSVPKKDRADELASAYINKIKKYDSSKALREQKHLKAVVAKDKQFREAVRAKRRMIYDQNREKQTAKKENLEKNEQKALHVLDNKAKMLAKVSSQAERISEMVAKRQDKVQEAHEGTVTSQVVQAPDLPGHLLPAAGGGGGDADKRVVAAQQEGDHAQPVPEGPRKTEERF